MKTIEELIERSEALQERAKGREWPRRRAATAQNIRVEGKTARGRGTTTSTSASDPQIADARAAVAPRDDRLDR
jgi:hypothetical protein